jgi:predicted ATPase/DNA-binding CsgD family transcriptional regulator
VRPEQIMASATAAGRFTGLPASLTPLVGRQEEVAAVCAFLRQPEVRLLTLTGPGGVGKTRLALSVVDAIAGDFPDGIVFVPAAPIADPALLLPAIGRALDVRESLDRPLRDRVIDVLGHQRRLLVLDNLEQLIAGAADVGTLVDACPGLKVLVTSRIPLRLAGEQEFAVPPLDRTAAVALFVERAHAARHDFAPTGETLATVSEVCARLDRLPLAIELAAARTKVLSPEALLVRLSHRLRLLTGGPRDVPVRLQTMRAAIAWSHDLLTPAEQALFRRLAVFAGGFTLEAAEYVGGQGGAPLPPFDGIASLVDKSLVRGDGELDTGAPRFAMLETVREFGLECLARSGEEETVRDVHAAWGLGFLEEAESHAFDPNYGAWLDRFDAEHDNLRAALHWYEQTGRIAAAAALIGRLWSFWFARGHLSEGGTWIDRTRRALVDAPNATRSRAVLALAAGWLAMGAIDYEKAIANLAEARTAWEAIGDERQLASSLFGLGVTEQDEGHPDRAADHFQQALVLFRRLRLPIWVGLTLNNLGLVVARAGDPARGASLLEEGIALQRANDYRLGAAVGLRFLGQVSRLAGDDGKAVACYQECLVLDPEHAQPWHVPNALEGLAEIAADARQCELATRLLGCADALRQVAGIPLEPALTPAQDRLLATLRADLGERPFVEAWDSGREMKGDAILAAARAVTLARPGKTVSGTTVPSSTTGLSPREVEVLRLLAAGRSNQEIAADLSISVLTVKTHVANLLAKLGLPTRAAAAAYVHRQGLN